MKNSKVSLFSLFFALVFCCISASLNAEVKEPETVEVLVFHGVKQCETCQAIKKNTKEVVEQNFNSGADQGKVTFRIVDFSQPENKAIAEKYEIAWTSVVLIKHTADGKEEVKNISKMAIENARTNTPVYREKLSDEIKALID